MERGVKVSKDILLRAKGICKSFGGATAVHDVSFDLKAGEILGIMGPNGSGKTTLINIITGFVKPDSGAIYFRRKKITKKKPYKIANMGIARTFQNIRPYYSLPAFKNLIAPLCSPRVKRAGGGKLGDRDAVAIDILEEIGFERDSYVPYKSASALPQGYLKRLELARCIALRPEIIIADELFSGLSMSEIATMLPIVEKLQINGVTIIMIEHRLKELFMVAGRIIVMNFGVKVAEGRPDAVMENEAVKEAYFGRKKRENN
ncbi:ABC transporter [Candidatus Desulfarcum epimagneticum]|uniref:ABC transporter n=1 Tax=uncultured Desulfobacteraceae bacterium TaxID=218296 RepID=A0A484HIK7_9BACT|nr:ABC transporter [uncultured Desulfobacteraceae bacterium]